ncbi:anti-sigma factor [Oryzibacter oryziterrae]|uniref:anti-sigma factor n=1 Tax=Oryzibacter oryziterrae TaxID=2766474 RepID=UPI001F032193|nr:anti-sigma factor [Oryzibacter oryziterrae]
MTADDNELQAGEYVLGSLGPEERLTAQERIKADPAFAAAVRLWEGHLAPLMDDTPPVEPSARINARIAQEIAMEAAVPRVNPAERLAPEAYRPDAEIVDLSARLRRLKLITALAGSLAAAFAGVVVYDRMGLLMRAPVDGQHYVAVVNRDASLPALIVDVDTGLGELTVRPVATEAPAADRSLELWIIPAGGSPISLGVVDTAAKAYRVADKTGSIRSTGTFAVTVEPKGGAPEGIPTGPVVYSGKLVKVTD